jgi:hypothetical protein
MDAGGLDRMRQWERTQELRALAVGMPNVDRKGMEHYLRTRGSLAGSDAASVQVTTNRALKLHSLHGSAQLGTDFFHLRTVLDAIFVNSTTARLEGTFEYPLPPGSEAVYVAVFAATPDARPNPPRRFDWRTRVKLTDPIRAAIAPEDLAGLVGPSSWEKLLEGRGRSASRPTKPVGEGATFCAGPFPIAAGGACRVLFAYVQPFTVTDGALQYRCPMPAGDGNRRFTVRFPSSDCVTPHFSAGAQKMDGPPNQLCYTWTDPPAGGEVVFRFASALGGKFVAVPPGK